MLLKQQLMVLRALFASPRGSSACFGTVRNDSEGSGGVLAAALAFSSAMAASALCGVMKYFRSFGS